QALRLKGLIRQTRLSKSSISALPKTKNNVQLKYKILAFLAPSILILDQWTKHLVHTTFHLYESRIVVPSVFALTYVHNRGAAFSFLDDAPPGFRDPFFTIMPIVALTAIGFLFVRLKKEEKLTAISLIM